MNNIYNISQELLTILAEIEENDGDVTPEIGDKFAITENDLKNKIKSYSNLVKKLQVDILAIKEEKERLTALEKVKSRTIDRFKSIITEAVITFGQTTPAGGKYIDYGTGKVNIRNTKIVEVDEDATNRFLNRYFTGLIWYNSQNQLHQNICNSDKLLEYANSESPEELCEHIEIVKFNADDLSKLKALINIDLPMSELLNSKEGYNLAKALVNYKNFSIKAKADKMEIKREAKENNKLPVFAKLIDSTSLTIK